MKLINELINNQYEVVDKIGEDLHSVIWRAKRINSNEIVALRFLKHKNSFYSIEDLLRFKRETALVSRLNHQNIAGIIEIDDYNEYTYIVTEIIDGENLADCFNRKENFSIDEAITIIINTSNALQAAHHNGIVHGALTPECIWLNSTDTGKELVKLAGFGFSELRELTSITEPADIVNTFSYMSPEASGIIIKSYDERSDLYSLGIIFYQMLTGELPFSGKDIDEILHKHIAMMPPSPSILNNDISKVLDSIVLKLLSKDQEERYQSAMGLSSDLEKILNREKDFRLALEDRMSRLSFNTRLVGRDKELALLRHKFNKLSEGTGSFCFVIGDAGMGKTRLVGELRGDVFDKGGIFLYGKCFSGEKKMPYQVFHDALGDYIDFYNRLPGQQQINLKKRISGILGELGEVILLMNPVMKDILGAVNPMITLEPDKGNERFLNVASNFFCSMGIPEAPVVLFLDDLQYADESSLYLISEIAYRVTSCPLLVIGSYSGNEIPEDHKFETIIRDYPEIEVITLSHLDANQLRSFVSKILGQKEQEIPSALVDYLLDKSKGNPFFVIEIIRHLLDEHVIFHGITGWEINLDKLRIADVPSSIVDIILKRIKLLNEEERELIATGALIGSSFELKLLYRLSSLSQENILNAVDKAIELQFLERDMTEKGRLHFVDDRIRENFLRKISEKKKGEIHLSIARAIEEEDIHSDFIFSLAHHYNSAGDYEKSLEYSIPAGDISKKRNAHDEAIGYYRHVLGLLEDKGEKESKLWLEILESLGEVYLTTGSYDEAVEVFFKILPYIKSGIKKAEIYKHISMAFFKKGDFTGSERYGGEGLKILSEKLPQKRFSVIMGIVKEFIIHLLHVLFSRIVIGSKEKSGAEKTKLIVQFYLSLNWSYVLSDILKFIRATFRVLNITESKIGKSSELAMSTGGYASMLMAIPVFDRALYYHKKALNMRRELKDQWGVGQSLQWLGYLYQWTGDFQRSTDYFERSMEEFRKIGDTREYGISLLGRVHNSYFCNDYINLEKYNDRFFRIVSKSRDVFGITSSLMWSGLLCLDLGKLDEAEDYFFGAHRLCREKEIWFVYIITSAFLGQLFCDRGEVSRAIEFLEEAMDLFQKNSFLKQYTVMVYPFLAEAYIASYEIERERNVPGSEKFLKKAKRACRESLKKTKNWVTWHGVSLSCISYYYALTGRSKKSGKYFTKCIESFKKTGSMRYWMGRAFYKNGYIQKKMGRHENANLDLQRAYSIFDELKSKYYLEKTSKLLGIDNIEDTSKERFIDRRRLSSVISVSQQISSILNIKELLENIVAKAIEVTGAMRGGLFILNDNTGELELRAYKSVELRSDDEKDLQYLRSIVDEVFQTGKQIIIHNAMTNRDIVNSNEANSQDQKSVLCIPIVIRDKRLGVFYLDNRLSRSVFSESDIELLNVFFSQAAISIENASLYSNLEQKVEERTKELRKTQQKLVEAAHQAGMAEIATGVLHNIGNILNSMSIASEEISHTIRKSKIDGLLKAGTLLRSQLNNIDEFIMKDERGKLLPEYYSHITDALQKEHSKLTNEIVQLEENIQMMKDSIDTHQDYARSEFLTESLNLRSIIEDALKVQRNDLFIQGIKVVKDYDKESDIFVTGQRTKLIHILLNLLKNASEAMGKIPPEERIITISIDVNTNYIFARFTDTGEGILQENLKKIFNYGYTTRANGHGFGLHTCANFMAEMDGGINCESPGPGKGATFTLVFPSRRRGG